MSRAPYQILVFPVCYKNGQFEYALFKRADANYWQGVAGGGEGSESPLEAALRETEEESGLSDGKIIKLDSQCSVPVPDISGFLWGPGIPVITEFAFGFLVDPNSTVLLSDEHLDNKWFNFDDALKAVKWDSNRTALWELNYRLSHAI